MKRISDESALATHARGYPQGDGNRRENRNRNLDNGFPCVFLHFSISFLFIMLLENFTSLFIMLLENFTSLFIMLLENFTSIPADDSSAAWCNLRAASGDCREKRREAPGSAGRRCSSIL